MMLFPRFRPCPAHAIGAAVPAWALVAVLVAGGSVDAGRAAEQGSLVVCAPAWVPVRAAVDGRMADGRMADGPGASGGLVRRIGDDRFMAPTRPAMFFSRPGDRCSWHAVRRARS